MNKQPSSSLCFVCGVDNPHGLKMQFYQSENGDVCADYRVPAAYQSYPGMAHGGIIAAMLDEVSGRSLMPAGGDRFMVTASLSIRYRKPVPVEQPLHLVGKAGKDNGRVASARGCIYDAQGTLLAEADAVLVNIPEDRLAEAQGENQGWKVYPDEEVKS